MSDRVQPGHANSPARVSVVLVGLVVLSLCVFLATRSFHYAGHDGVTVQSADTQAARQHLEQNAVQWLPPVAEFRIVEVSASYPRFAPVAPRVITVLFHKSLYNRPPPSC